eukprot:TRINITY_DN4067_c0_g1_i3.p1 TRINITY_DN4067_c0_g1~~TRINITY_DN4067_c0_g1_i3.p1  ORF type:complete len:588 (+),score=159.63 TRINITY_DN4067_c0_g1_i3:78-1766(+)
MLETSLSSPLRGARLLAALVLIGGSEAAAGWQGFLPPVALDVSMPYPPASQCQPCPHNGIACCKPRSSLPPGAELDTCPAGHLCCDDCGVGVSKCSCDLRPCTEKDNTRVVGTPHSTTAARSPGLCCALCEQQGSKCAAATHNTTHCLFFSAAGPLQSAGKHTTVTPIRAVQRRQLQNSGPQLSFMLFAFVGLVSLVVLVPWDRVPCIPQGQRREPRRKTRKGELICAQDSRELGGYLWEADLATGGFSTVCAVTRVRDGKRLAMKEIGCSSREDAEYALSEGKILDQFQGHPNMVTVLDRFFDTRTWRSYGSDRPDAAAEAVGARYCIVMQLYSEGDLNQYLERILKSGGRTSETVVRSVVAQIGQLLHHLHGAQRYGHAGPVIHRDLKPQNILVQARGPDGGLHVIVTDFGLARLQERTYVYTQAGSMPYMAPECWRRKYGRAVDIWSLGCIAYVMATLRVGPSADHRRAVRCLFAEAHDVGFSAGLRAEVLGHGYSTVTADLVTDCVQIDPRMRPSAEDVLSRLGVGLVPWRPTHAAEMPEEARQVRDHDESTALMQSS